MDGNKLAKCVQIRVKVGFQETVATNLFLSQDTSISKKDNFSSFFHAVICHMILTFK